MIVLQLEALAAIAVALSASMAGAFIVQQRTGNSGSPGTGSIPLPPEKGLVT